MIDLHTHSILSDGDLLPAELARRAEEKGIEIIAITDHVDDGTLDNVLSQLVKSCSAVNERCVIRALPGVEITHVHPEQIGALAARARDLGAKIVVVHGETLVEPVYRGTNRKGLESDIDILAHPGLLAEDDARLAAERKIAVEISGRRGHCLANGHVVRLWYEYGFPLVLNTDTHAPENLFTDEFARNVVLAAGVSEGEVQKVLDNSRALAEKALKL